MDMVVNKLIARASILVQVIIALAQHKLRQTMKRKPVLLVDDSTDSTEAINLFDQSGIDYVRYHVKKFEESCCGELPTTKAPAVFAPDGIFKGLDGVKHYLSQKHDYEKQSESAYW